jgi:ADP-ribose pyrophosphatase YjhB (NUDIX family)
MEYGISAAALVVEGERILLVHHQEAERFDFWVPPGGRLKGNESIFECAKREALEETGLIVELDRIVYIQEFWEPEYHFCKFFILGRTLGGDLTLANKEQGEGFLVDARFFSQDDLRDVTVHPEILKDQFWDDLKVGFMGTRYLGLERLRY